MRVALIHYSAPPVVGGVEQIIAAHARLFRQTGHEVTMICRTGAGDILLRDSDPYAKLKAVVAGCDVVFVHNVLTMPFDLPLTGAVWRLSGEEPRKRWISWIHDIAACNTHYAYDWRIPPWNRLAQAAPDFEHVAISRRRAFEFETLTGQRPEVIPNGVFPGDVIGLTQPVASFAASHRLEEREIVLFHPTRLLRRKNVEFGFRVLNELRLRGRDAAFVVSAVPDTHNAASREYAEALRALRAQLGLQSTALFVSDHFVPDKADVASLYRLADALFFPSLQEGFGLPILEAALHRLPIFCADIQPLNSLLDQPLHYFNAEASPSEVAALIEERLEQSTAYRARKEALCRYSWDVVWEKHLAPLLRREGLAP